MQDAAPGLDSPPPSEQDNQPSVSLTIAQWIDAGLHHMGNANAGEGSSNPTVREQVYNNYQWWLKTTQHSRTKEKLLGQQMGPVSVDLAELFEYAGRKRIPRQDQIELFATVCGIDINNLMGQPGDNNLPLVDDPTGPFGLHFNSALGLDLEQITTALVNQVRDQRPDIEISETISGTAKTVQVPTRVEGLSASIAFNIDPHLSAQGLPRINSLILSFTPEQGNSLVPLTTEEFNTFTHRKPKQSPADSPASDKQQKPDIVPASPALSPDLEQGSTTPPKNTVVPDSIAPDSPYANLQLPSLRVFALGAAGIELAKLGVDQARPIMVKALFPKFAKDGSPLVEIAGQGVSNSPSNPSEVNTYLDATLLARAVAFPNHIIRWHGNQQNTMGMPNVAIVVPLGEKQPPILLTFSPQRENGRITTADGACANALWGLTDKFEHSTDSVTKSLSQIAKRPWYPGNGLLKKAAAQEVPIDQLLILKREICRFLVAVHPDGLQAAQKYAKSL